MVAGVSGSWLAGRLLGGSSASSSTQSFGSGSAVASLWPARSCRSTPLGRRREKSREPAGNRWQARNYGGV